MLPKWHVLYGFIFSIILVYFFDFSFFAGVIIFLSAVFIDLDHVLICIFEAKSLNPVKFYSRALRRRYIWLDLERKERDRYKYPNFILHGIELAVILFVLSYLHIFFFWVLLGCLLHLALDILETIYTEQHISYKTSQIWLWQRNKNKKEWVIE